MKSCPPKTLFFATPADFRAWLENNHALHTELGGFYKRDSGKPASRGLSRSTRRSATAGSTASAIPSTRSAIVSGSPRKPTSTWSAINLKRVAELTKLGLMHSAGIKAFEARKADKTGIYATSNARPQSSHRHARRNSAPTKPDVLPATTPWYQRTAIYRVISAKQEVTRENGSPS
jgi:uncharacterized protein YdeI (YjbR/CyaY-like superfamily)